MGMARKAGARHSRWPKSIYQLRKSTPKGAPVPGVSTRGYHRSRSGSNKSGSLHKLNLEWGSKNRKEEDELRGINNRARREAIRDQLS